MSVYVHRVVFCSFALHPPHVVCVRPRATMYGAGNTGSRRRRSTLSQAIWCCPKTAAFSDLVFSFYYALQEVELSVAGRIPRCMTRPSPRPRRAPRTNHPDACASYSRSTTSYTHGHHKTVLVRMQKQNVNMHPYPIYSARLKLTNLLLSLALLLELDKAELGTQFTEALPR